MADAQLDQAPPSFRRAVPAGGSGTLIQLRNLASRLLDARHALQKLGSTGYRWTKRGGSGAHRDVECGAKRCTLCLPCNELVKRPAFALRGERLEPCTTERARNTGDCGGIDRSPNRCPSVNVAPQIAM